MPPSKNQGISDYQIKYSFSKRKTIALSIDKDLLVHVKAPLGFTEETLKPFIVQKEAWLKKHMAKRLQNNEKMASEGLVWGKRHYYKGQCYDMLVEAKQGVSPQVVLGDKTLVLRVSEPDDMTLITQTLVNWYQHQTLEAVQALMPLYSKQMGVKPKRVTIKEQKKRWGSCSSLGHLHFNWRLSMAPQEVIAYLVVHELAHLVHMNHSKDFWTLVARHMPDYKVHQKWLKENAQAMMIDPLIKK